VSAVSCGFWGRHLFSVPVALQGPEHTYKGSAEAQSEQLGRSTPDLHSAGRGSNIRIRREHEDQGSGVQQPPEVALEHAFGGGQDGGDAHDLTQSGRSRGKPWRSGYTMVCTDHYQSRREARLTRLLGVP
jgi:hypothetical protein